MRLPCMLALAALADRFSGHRRRAHNLRLSAAMDYSGATVDYGDVGDGGGVGGGWYGAGWGIPTSLCRRGRRRWLRPCGPYRCLWLPCPLSDDLSVCPSVLPPLRPLARTHVRSPVRL